MQRVSALILLAAVGVHSFVVNGKALRQPTKVSGPFTSTLPFPSPTSLQQHRWDRDYRDNAPVGEPRTRRYGNRNSFTGPPSIYNEAPQSTEAGWWNEEKKNYGTSESRMDRRVYTSNQYNSNINNGMRNNNYLPVANVNAQRYDVTPEEWKQNGAGGYNNNDSRYYENYDRNPGNFENGRRPQILRANDRDPRAHEYNGGMASYDYQNDFNNNNMNNNGYNNQNFQQQQGQYNNNNDYNYGFGGSRGQVVGTFNNNNNYDPNDVTPAEWQDSKMRRRQDGYMVPGPGREQNMMNNGFNNNMNNNNDFRMNYNGNFNDNGLYDPTQGQAGNWWNQESKDYRTNIGRQETRAFGGGPMTMANNNRNRNGVTPDEWNDYRDGGSYRFGMQPVSYKDNVQGPPRQVRSWWDNVKNGFRNNNSYNSRYGNNYNYNGNRGYSQRYSNNYNNNNNNRNRNNQNGLNGGGGFVNVGYNNNNNYNDNYQQNNNNNGYYPRYDNYYDDYSRPEYVTQDRDWWKEENRNYNTW
mmetsp:Transcript_24949/g.61377  ORF Transcript_24949/g.61377 Transcript_24949/m.61377 type:complete len:523 (+) Transcript_24949:215-1783(+)